MRKTRKGGMEGLRIRGRKFNNENENENVWELPLNKFNIRQFAPGNNNMYSSSNLRWANKPVPINVRKVNTMSPQAQIMPYEAMNVIKTLNFSNTRKRARNNNRTKNNRTKYAKYNNTNRKVGLKRFNF